jgi:hypothetical protein
VKCPIDTETDLVMTDRSGVEIDYCPKCRGVWLDRGELDKIIDRATADTAAPVQAAPQAPPVAQPQAMAPAPGQVAPPPPMRWDSSDRYYQQGPGQGYPRKRKSFLKEMFDF